MNAHNLNPSTAGDTSAVTASPAGGVSENPATATRVATSVWWLDDRGGATAATRDDTRFVSRLARRLVLTYTRRGEAIIDFDGDTALRHAAAATTRIYVALTRRHRIAELDHLIRPASLTILRWPRPGVPATTASINDLLLACQLIATTAPSILAVASDIEPGDTSTSHSPELDTLLAAATKARFTHTQRILALSTLADDGDTYTYYPDDTGADAAVDTWRDTTRPGVRVDILRYAAPERHGA